MLATSRPAYSAMAADSAPAWGFRIPEVKFGESESLLSAALQATLSVSALPVEVPPSHPSCCAIGRNAREHGMR